jgi:hypothetical protein
MGCAGRIRPNLRPVRRTMRAGLQRTAYAAAFRQPDGGWLPPVSGSLRRDDERAEHGVQHLYRCQSCDGFPRLVHAKSDAEVVAVRPALEFPNVTLLRS